MSNPQPAAGGAPPEVEIISQPGDEDARSAAAGPLASFAYRDLPLAPGDLSTAGSQLLSNLDEDYQREGSPWLRPCCGKRAAVWQVFLLSASLNSVLVACVILVVILLTLELLIDIKLLQFPSAFQFAGVIHWVSLLILSGFFSETVLRIVVLGLWDYIENKIEVFDGAVIVLSLAPMVASTVANGPRSPWDAISLIILLRIWRVKRVIDAYVLPVRVELELVVQQYEKAKAVRDEQLERLTQICQEQGTAASRTRPRAWSPRPPSTSTGPACPPTSSRGTRPRGCAARAPGPAPPPRARPAPPAAPAPGRAAAATPCAPPSPAPAPRPPPPPGSARRTPPSRTCCPRCPRTPARPRAPRRPAPSWSAGSACSTAGTRRASRAWRASPPSCRPPRPRCTGSRRWSPKRRPSARAAGTRGRPGPQEPPGRDARPGGQASDLSPEQVPAGQGKAVLVAEALNRFYQNQPVAQPPPSEGAAL
ncbi:transmembrane protein 266 isoform X2 [Pipistrellus kuhlii]|uniref:transmembrane protein 266 isoform X2 n=1 Tax=Pipistrellus kuhlii TaxID=59472 RepID=UPI001E274837|nr:transmembrane protein 266 isoform X2 [Pipistrellus kuhlii]